MKKGKNLMTKMFMIMTALAFGLMTQATAFASGINDGTQQTQSTLVRAANGVQTAAVVLIIIAGAGCVIAYIWFKTGGRHRKHH